MWNIGSNVKEMTDKKNGFKTAKKLYKCVLGYDSTRLIALTFNKDINAFDFNLTQQVDFVGINYGVNIYKDLLTNYPQTKLFCSMSNGTKSKRGNYPNLNNNIKKPLKNSSTSYLKPIEYESLNTNSDILGYFIWAGLDFINKNINTQQYTTDYGQADICGFPKDNFYLYKSLWSNQPIIHLLPHWNWSNHNKNIIPVKCYTNCEEVELFINGTSLGKKAISKNKTNSSKHILSWNVPYKAGRLKAIGYQNGIVVKENYIDTHGKPYRVILSKDKNTNAVNDDLVYVTVKILDKNGKICTNANPHINFKLKGNAKIIALDNGQGSEDFDNINKKRAYKGMCLAILKVNGSKKETIELTAKVNKLKSYTLKLIIQ